MTNPLTFSTLACPHWPIETVIANAAAFGYAGLEWRGGPQGHVHPALPSSAKAMLRQTVADVGLISLAITAYTSFVSDDAADRQANVDELKRYADLAAEVGARYIRAFLGELAPGADLTPTYPRISESLARAAEYAASVGVVIAIEPHDDFVRSASVAPILQSVPHPGLGVIWDIANAFSAGEEPDEGFHHLGQRLTYVQVKDGVGRGPNWQLTSVGQGQVPLARAFQLLANYPGALSVEWEYAWHPKLDPPEVALPQALQQIRALLAEAQNTNHPGD